MLLLFFESHCRRLWLFCAINMIIEADAFREFSLVLELTKSIVMILFQQRWSHHALYSAVKYDGYDLHGFCFYC